MENSTATAGDYALEARGLSKSFGSFYAVKDVDLKVRRGTIHALIGPNGAGKTTCFNLLTKTLTPTAGQVIYEGRDITGLRTAQVAKLGLVRSFQISATFPHLTCLENVRVALQSNHGKSFRFWSPLSAIRSLDPRVFRRRNCPTARNVRWKLPPPWRWIPRSCFWTNPRPAWATRIWNRSPN